MTAPSAADVQATWCATLVDQWVRLGLTHAVVAPGSRSTPLALALAARTDLHVEIAHDERSAAFIALGIGVATGRPAALLCTSGTAATHFHAAVVEAHLAGVPLLALTADRPPELHGIGAPQTIDQQRLFGPAAAFVDHGVPDWEQRHRWRAWADEVWSVDAPVHLNLPFREPLVGTPVELPAATPVPAAAVAASPDLPAVFGDLVAHQRGVIVAGRGVDDPAAVDRLAVSLGWPVLADPRSGCRGASMSVAAFDSLVRNAEFAAAHTPTAVLHLGEPPASKVLGQWLQASGAVHVQVLPRDAVIDPLRLMSWRLVAPIGAVCRSLVGAGAGGRDTPWAARWRRAEQRAQVAIDEVLGGHGALTEPTVARLLSGRPGALVVASSMPVRDVEWFGRADQVAEVHANRGTNGIDGVVATAIGVALGRADRRATVLLGDVALCHDASSLTALARRPVEVTIVCTDNDGGGIFSFLPQATQLQADRFEQLFGTPHGTDLVALASAHGLPSVDAVDEGGLLAALAGPGSRFVRVRTDRAANVQVHDRLHAAVAAAL